MLYLGLSIIISTLFLFLLWQLLQRLQSHCLNYIFHETPDNLWWLSIMHSATFLFPVIHGLWTILSYPQLYSSSEWVPIVMDLGTLWFSDSIVQLISNLCFVLAGFLLFEDFFLSLLIFAENNCKIVSEERVLRILSLPWEDITQMLIWWRLPVLLFGLFHWKVNGVHSRFTLLKVGVWI